MANQESKYVDVSNVLIASEERKELTSLQPYKLFERRAEGK